MDRTDIPVRHHRTFAAPLGAVRMGFAADGRLVRIELPDPGRRAGRVEGPAPAGIPDPEAVQAWLDRVLHGEAVPFPGDVAWPVPGTFTGRVYRAVAAIPPGETRTYGEVAAACGSPGAARAVGSAMARNPLPLLIPCHRVTAADGLGGFGGGLPMKRALLAAEAGGPAQTAPAYSGS